MKVMLTPDEVVAKVWDDYLHRFGAAEYITARYFTPSTTMPKNDDALDDHAAGAFLSPGPGLGRFEAWATPSQPPVAE